MSNNGDTVVVYFSRTGENYAVGKTTVGSTAKVAAEIMRQTGAAGVAMNQHRKTEKRRRCCAP
ncbi:hypothetical protein [Bifidobacterium leontopitheci]|uniref:Uncharacterized protein n=1 Tax=Bifidobacterium leontopitheci TaxID=2650774 RepID=A0A6I1GL33_9BIFI|nr:hypothetical protein [Bifidobacterium leontopitheci]KAB7790306.1 hypothetical protein F7D09_1202 [Bifidobacterium leontopitheci]